MRSLKQTLLRQRVTRLSRETGYHPDVLRLALDRAERLRLSPAEVDEVLAAARRDEVPPAQAVDSYAARRAAGLAGLASGELGLGAGAAIAGVVEEGDAGGAPALELGLCDSVVSGDAVSGRPWLVTLRPRGEVDLSPEAVARAAAGAAVRFTLERGSLAERLVREGACEVRIDAEWLAERAARQAAALQPIAVDLEVADGADPSRLLAGVPEVEPCG